MKSFDYNSLVFGSGRLGEALATWSSLLFALRNSKEQDCLKLLEHEIAHKHRWRFEMRIYGHYNLLRSQRERREVCMGKWKMPSDAKDGTLPEAKATELAEEPK